MTVAVRPVPVADARSPAWRRVLTPAALGAGLAAWAVGLRLRDPYVPGSWGSCPFLVVTGLPCPVCGGLRAVNSLTHGDLAGALGSNLLVVLAVPVAVAWWVTWVRRAATRPGPGLTAMPLPSPRTAWLGFALVVAFGVLRWLPAASGLGP